MPLTYKELRKILDECSYELSHQRGSHKKFRKGSHTFEILKHKELAKGTEKIILGDIAGQNNTDINELKKNLSHK